MIIAKAKEEREFILVPSGTHQAVCYDVWDVGNQRQVFRDKSGKETVNILHKVYLAFEVNKLMPSGPMQGKRMTISKQYTLSLSRKANLKKDLEAWRGKVFTAEELKGFVLDKLIGVNCNLSVIHNETKDGKRFANISTISTLMEGLTPMIQENKRSEPDWVKKMKEKAIKEEPKVEEPLPQYDESGQIVSSDEPDETEPPF